MAKHARGLVCLTITEARAKQLGLTPMARDNKSPYNTAFTTSIEAAEGVTTGISAQDRAAVSYTHLDAYKRQALQALSSLGLNLQVRSYEERSMGKGGDAKACAFMEITHNGSEREYYGVGMDANIVTASIKALLSGVNRVNAKSVAAQAA